MPLWLRNATFNWEKEYYDKQNEENKKNVIDNKDPQQILKPNIPDYSVKAPRK